MPDEIGAEAVFKVFVGPPVETVANVNRSLRDYVVVNWNWSVAGDMVVLSALLVSKREVQRTPGLVIAGPQIAHRG